MNAATGANGNTPLRFGTQYVTYEMQINPNNMKSIQFNCQPHGDVQMYMNQNDINCLSHYFERKVSSPPYRPNTAKGIEIITNFTMESTLNGIKLTKMYHNWPFLFVSRLFELSLAHFWAHLFFLHAP